MWHCDGPEYIYFMSLKDSKFITSDIDANNNVVVAGGDEADMGPNCCYRSPVAFVVPLFGSSRRVELFFFFFLHQENEA